MENDIAYLKRLTDATDSETAGNLERIIDLLDIIQSSPDSFSEQAERLDEAARRLRELKGLDPDDHNEICLMAERFDQEETGMVRLGYAMGC